MLCLLAACSSSSRLDTERYYDPSGLFSATLPTANQIVVATGQNLAPKLDLLSGVLALPQTASPSPSSAFGGGFIQPATQQDTAIYSVSAVKAQGVKSVTALATTLLGQTTHPQVKAQQRVIVDGLPGLLVITDHRNDSGGKFYSDASAFFLIQSVGYWIREIFNFGAWNARRAGFRQIMDSFRFGVPEGIRAVPIVPPGISIQSSLSWPLG